MNMERKKNIGRDVNRIPLYTVVPRSVPFSLGIAASDICNFKCNYCNQSTPQGIKNARIIPWEDFLILAEQIKDLSDFGKEHGEDIKNIRFIGNGEPLINKRLPDMIAYLKQLGVSKRFEVTTNASLLTHEMSDRLIESGITRLLISIQGVNSERYKDICRYNMDMDKLIENIAYFYKNKNKAEVYIKTVDISLKSDEETKLFYEMFEPICNEINVEKIMNACADVDYSKITDNDLSKTMRYGQEFKKKICCDTLFMYMNIHSNFNVDCCGCIYPPLFIGNAYKLPLKEIWNGEKHREVMKLHLQGKKDSINMCKNCSSINSYNGFIEDNLDEHLKDVLERVCKL